jgi:hypothetical protein
MGAKSKIVPLCGRSKIRGAKKNRKTTQKLKENNSKSTTKNKIVHGSAREKEENKRGAKKNKK